MFVRFDARYTIYLDAYGESRIMSFNEWFAPKCTHQYSLEPTEKKIGSFSMEFFRDRNSIATEKQQKVFVYCKPSLGITKKCTVLLFFRSYFYRSEFFEIVYFVYSLLDCLFSIFRSTLLFICVMLRILFVLF